jgi:pyroglutamyl-peptidase
MADILLTGFEPFGGRGLNPSAEIARALDGSTVGGWTLRSVLLPVSMAEAGAVLDAAIDEVAPRLILSLGLWAGEPMIRLERRATNFVDCEIADNAGFRPRGEQVAVGGPAAREATLPIAPALTRLRALNIPAYASESAGSFLCNATFYRALSKAEAMPGGIICGFVHFPYLPQQVSLLLEDLDTAGLVERHQRSDYASMALDMMVAATACILQSAIDGRS